jgi:Domain of unknown function (DUF4337)
MEPTEIHEFASQLQEASDGGGEPLTHISLAISILAVLVAMVTVLAHRTHTLAVLEQTRAADQWNQYQAKKIRMDNVGLTVDLLALQSSGDPGAIAAKTTAYNAQIAKWKEDLAEEEKKAHEYESEVDLAEKKAARYDLGEALLQVGVVLSSVTLFTRNRAYFFLGLSLGLAGLVTAVTGLLLHTM